MLLCCAACARCGFHISPVTLLLVAIMLGASVSVLRAAPNNLPQRVQGGAGNAGGMSVKTSDGVVDTSFSVSIREIADLLSKLPDGEADAGDFKVEPSSKGDVARIALPPPEAPRRFDVWSKGRYRKDTLGDDSAPSGTLFVGAEHQVSSRVTLGGPAGLNQVEPHLAVKGRWDLAPVTELENDAYIPSWDGLDAKLEGGVRLQDFKDWFLDANVGGVGGREGAIDWRGRVGIKVPLN